MKRQMKPTPRARAKPAREGVAMKFWFMVNDGVSTSKGLSIALVLSEHSCVNSLSIFFFFLILEYPNQTLIKVSYTLHENKLYQLLLSVFGV